VFNEETLNFDYLKTVWLFKLNKMWISFSLKGEMKWKKQIQLNKN
jgi:hypothetical protein